VMEMPRFYWVWYWDMKIMEAASLMTLTQSNCHTIKNWHQWRIRNYNNNK
jgi:hypothetical protein